MTDTDHLARMANDIGNFFRAQPQEDAVAGIANHIRSFWTPKMRLQLTARMEQGNDGLDELPRSALLYLKEHPVAEPSQPPGGDAG